MAIFDECFEENDRAFKEQLRNAEFPTDQARHFLPEAASRFFDYSQDKDLEQIARQLVSDNPVQFFNSVCADAIAEKLYMNSDLVKKSLAAIMPLLANTFLHKIEGLIGAVTSLAPGLVKRFS